MWVLVAACFTLFALFLLLVPGMTFAIWWPSILAALLASALTVLCAAAIAVWLLVAASPEKDQS